MPARYRVIRVEQPPYERSFGHAWVDLVKCGFGALRVRELTGRTIRGGVELLRRWPVTCTPKFAGSLLDRSAVRLLLRSAVP